MDTIYLLDAFLVCRSVGQWVGASAVGSVDQMESLTWSNCLVVSRLVVWTRSVNLTVGQSVGGSLGRSVIHRGLVCVLVGWLVGRSVCWLVGRLVGWSVGRSVGWSVGWSARRNDGFPFIDNA